MAVEGSAEETSEEEALQVAGSTKVQEFFKEDDLHNIGAAVKDVETRTCGEVRVNIFGSLPEKFTGTAREFAEGRFVEEGLHNTQDQTGILIFVALKERAIEILADSGIDAKVSDQVWIDICMGLAAGFQEENYVGSVLGAVSQVGAVLEKHCPVKDGDKNELPDAPTVG